MADRTMRDYGWERDLPDHRDYTPRHLAVLRMMDSLSLAAQAPGERPSVVDRRDYFPAIQDQGPLATSAAHACSGLVQYFERFSSGRIIQPSRMFIHHAAARLGGRDVRLATNLRSTIKAVVRFGLPPERFFPYEPENLNTPADSFCFSFADDWRSLRYARLDSRGASGGQVLESVQAFLAAGFPCAFGFLVTTAVSADPNIPFPTVYDVACGSQSVIAVGYDDRRRIRSERGALLIRNSWGTAWGDGGYGWLPYAYVRHQLAADFWTLLRPDWLGSGEFARPADALP
jgi:C1A family cysteine protease